MNPLDALNYGTASFAIVAVIYIVYLFISKKDKSKQEESAEIKLIMESNKAVIENNTKALENLTSLLRELQISSARQEEKLNEILQRVRK